MIRWLAALVLLLTAQVAVAQELPKFTGLVVDAANVLPPETKADLTAKLQALQKDTNRQLVVATIPDLHGRTAEEYGNRLIRGWGVGLKDVNNGAILFIAPNEPPGRRDVRIEVGYGLEPVITDALSSVIIQQDMLPRLKAGDIPGAMTAGTDALIRQLRASPDEAKARTDAAVADYDRTHRRSGGRQGGGFPIALVFWGIVLAFVVVPMILGRARGRKKRGPWDAQPERGGSGMWPVVLWSIADEITRSGRQGGWGGGGWGGDDDDGGGGWGGGGFTGGGGGSGGGGGASGSW